MTGPQLLHSRVKAALAQVIADATTTGQKAKARRAQKRLDEVLDFERANPWIVA